jgi:ABC-2 type transport system permease protein
MKKILAIIWKDTIIRFATPWEIVFFIVLPLVFTYLLAGGMPSGDEDPRIGLLVVDEASTPASQEIVEQLEMSSAVRPEIVTREEAEKLFDDRRAEVVLFLPAGLSSDSIINGTANVELLQQPNNMNALAVRQAVSTAIRRVSSSFSAAQNAVREREQRAPFASDAQKQQFFEAALETAQAIQQDAPERVMVVEGSTEEMEGSPAYDPRANTSAGQLITWVFIPLFGISALFAYERQRGTLHRLLTTPVTKATFLLGTISGQVLLALVQMLLLVGFATLVLKLSWGHDPLALFAVLISSALAAAAFGTTLGTFVKTEGQANGLSIMFGMVFALLGGCWYPLELFPPAIQSAVRVLPTTWAMQGMLDLVLRGGGLPEVMGEVTVLLGFATLFFAVGVWRFRYD